MTSVQRDIRSVQKLQVLDGSFRTHLLSKGASSDMLNTVTSLVDYKYFGEKVRTIHLDYLRAGANVIRTNTFSGALPIVRKHYKTSISHYNKIIDEAVKRAREAINIHVLCAQVNKEDYWVLGSCGSVTGCRYLRLESLTKEICKDYHRDRIQMLLNAKVDGLALETIDSKVEADALLELLEEFPNARAYMSFRSYNATTVLDGSKLSDLIRSYHANLSSKLFAIGVNCVYPRQAWRVIEELNDCKSNGNCKIPLVLCPNNHELSKGPPIFKSMDVQNEYPALEWKEVGIRYLGGCCNTFPDDIRAIRKEMNKCFQRKALI